MNHDYESLHNMFKQRIELLAYAEDKESRTMRGITLRLPLGHIALIDRLATELGFSRNAFLDNLLDVVLQDSIRAMADQYPEEKRADLIKELFELMHSRTEGGANDE